jgi:hypothetical protein
MELTYRGGQEPIVHLQADLFNSVAWAQQNNQRWAFTLSNAGAFYSEDRYDLAQLTDINWQAVHTNRWGGNGIDSSIKEGKQAEFLMEHHFPWHLVERIGMLSRSVYHEVSKALRETAHKPKVEIKPEWYY